jgi:hypothetical protein
MRTTLVLLLLSGGLVSADTQQRGTGGGLATLAISVTDPAGAPLGNVRVIVEGPASRQTRTERGRVAIEELPAGAYKLRFELDGFVPLERELTARGGKPIEVKVALTPLPKAPAPPRTEPTPQPKPAVLRVSPESIDIPSFYEKNRVGSGPGKSSPLTCATAGTAVLLQMREPLEEHAHDEADEFAYVVGGEGTAKVGGTDHRLQAGVLVMIPRTIPHSFSARGRNPLVVMSIKAGMACPNQ